MKHRTSSSPAFSAGSIPHAGGNASPSPSKGTRSLEQGPHNRQEGPLLPRQSILRAGACPGATETPDATGVFAQNPRPADFLRAVTPGVARG